MALITPIQTSSHVNTTSAASITHAFPSDVVAGSVLLVCAGAKSVTGVDTPPTDTQGNTYTVMGSYTPQINWWRTVAGSSGPCSVTVDEAGGAGFFMIGLVEIPAGSYAYSEATFDSAFSTSVTTDPFTVTVDGAALFAVITTHAFAPVSITEEAGWTLIGENTNDTYLSYSLVWSNQDIGTHDHTWTIGATPIEYHRGMLVEGVPDPAALGHRHLLVGQNHSVSGSDLVAAGIGNTINGDVSQSHGEGSTVTGDHTVHFNLTSATNTVTTDRTFQVDADIINLNGTVEVNGSPIGGATDSFKTIQVSGQSDVVADSSTDTLTLVAGTNVTITTNAGTDTVTIAATGGGGGGDSTTTAAHASRPAVSNDGNLFLPNDGFYIDRDTGSVWQSWGPIFPMTPPVDGDFTWDNQGSASVVTTNGGICLSSPTSGSVNLRVRHKTAPATPYTITAGFLAALNAEGPQMAGVCFRQSSDGKLVVVGASLYLNAPTILVQKFTTSTAYSANYVLPVGYVGGLIFLRIADDGANRITSVSTDGINFVTLHTVGRTDFLTANQVGFFGAASTNYISKMTLLSWKEA
jgi:hypothetical protein